MNFLVNASSGSPEKTDCLAKLLAPSMMDLPSIEKEVEHTRSDDEERYRDRPGFCQRSW